MASTPTAVQSTLPPTTAPATTTAPPTDVHPAVAAVAASQQAAAATTPSTTLSKVSTFCLPMFSAICGSAKALTVLHDFDSAVNVLIVDGGIALVDAEKMLNVLNSQVSSLVLWLQAIQPMFATTATSPGNPQIYNAIGAAITDLQAFSLFAKEGQSIQSTVSTLPAPTNVANLATDIGAVQTMVVNTTGLISQLQNSGVNMNVNTATMANVNNVIGQIATAANLAATISRAQAPAPTVTIT